MVRRPCLCAALTRTTTSIPLASSSSVVLRAMLVSPAAREGHRVDANSDALAKTDEPIEFKMAGQADGALVPVNQSNHYP